MAEGNLAVSAAKPLTARGGIRKAPLGTDLPTDAYTALDELFKRMGYVTTDAVTQTTNRTAEDEYAWGNVVVDTHETEYGVVLAFTLMESSNAETLKAIVGDENVIVTPANEEHGNLIEVRWKSGLPAKAAWVIDMLRVKGGTQRKVAPSAQLVYSGDVQYVDSTSIKYSVELRCHTDEDDVPVYDYFDDGKVAGSAGTQQVQGATFAIPSNVAEQPTDQAQDDSVPA
ncbi:hypothetical protein [Brachybacterium squillarum]|uniref:hypothetical protein n=1 Tax=Brachybacterium squillarum TaxID=661979 RepID=UPI002223133B|nr:hypothetical protein [Brachybacterium squillarum]MCW1803875.1 hypothetical protein [Brachybacterium squillarum]